MEGSGGTHASLDDAGQRAAANDDPTGFVESAELPCAIDEFQKAPALLDAIKLRVDRERRGGRRPAGMFLLTGSANVWATLGISESLTGRAERIQLWPLSQGELEGRRERFLDDLLAGWTARIVGSATGRSAVSERLVVGGIPRWSRAPILAGGRAGHATTSR